MVLAAFNVLLARLSGQADVVVGTAIAGRGRPELEGLIGCFANTVAVRTKLDGAPTFREAVERTKHASLGAAENQDVPFAQVVEMLQPTRDASRTPIYQIMFAFFDAGDPFALADVDVALERGEGLGASLVDLWLTLTARGDEMSGSMQYDVNLFDRASVERFAEQYGALLASAMVEPDRAVETLSLDVNARAIAITATYPAAAVQRSLSAWLAQLGVACRTALAPYTPASLVAASKADGITVVLVRFEDWGGTANGSGSFTTEALASIEKSTRELIDALRSAASAESGVWAIVCITPPSVAALANDAFARHSERMGALLASELAGASTIRFVKSPEMVAPPADVPTDGPYTPAFCTKLGTALARAIYAQVSAKR